MAINNPQSGLFSVNEFQASPLPWLITTSTSGTSVTKHVFPRVTKSITLSNLDTSKSLRIGFTENGVNGVSTNNYFVVAPGQVVTLDIRVTEAFVRADTSATINYSLYAGLTTISSIQMPILSGTLPDGTVGWTGVG